MRKSLVAIAALAPLCLLSSSAWAGGISTARFGGEHGNPMTDSPTAIYYNPGGIARSEGMNIFLDVNLALRDVSYTHEPAPSDEPEPADAQGANNGTASTFNVAAAPMIGLTAKIKGDPVGLALGLGYYVPFGGQATWPQDERLDGHSQYAGIKDGVQRWYAIHGTIRSMYITGTAALSIVDQLYIGASGNVIYSDIDTLRARVADATNSIEFEGRSWLKASGWQGSFGLGVLWEPLPDELLLGFSYQAPPGIDGMKLQGKLKNNFGGAVTPDDEAKAQVEQDMPDIFRLGVSYRPVEDVELRLFGDLTRWNLLERQCIARWDPALNDYRDCVVYEEGDDIPDNKMVGDEVEPGSVVQNLPREWDPTVGVRIGMSYWLEPEVELFGGLGYDSNAVPDKTLDAALVDFHDISVALGGRFQIADWLHTAVSYTNFFYIPRDTTGNAEQRTAYGGPSSGPDAGGRYSQWIGVINLNFQASFDPF